MEKKKNNPITDQKPLEIPTNTQELLETLKLNIVQNALQTQIKIKEAEISKSDPKNRLDHLLIRYTKLLLTIEDKIAKQ